MIAKNSFIHSPQELPLKRPNHVHRQRQLKTSQISARKLQLYGKECRSAVLLHLLVEFVGQARKIQKLTNLFTL